MATLSDMKARIADEIARTDLTAQIALAINTAISEYAKERFRFSDTDPASPATFVTVADRFVYDAADNPAISSMMGIDYLAAQIGGMLQPLTPVRPEDARIYNQLGTMHGQPMWYAYEGNKLLLSPTPDQAYTMTFNVFRSVAAPADDAEEDNPWMNEGELLIRCRAKFEIATHLTRNKEMASAMSPDPPGATYRAWKSLKAGTNRAVGTGRIRPVQF